MGAGIRTGYGFRWWVRVSVVGAGFGGGCGFRWWVRGLGLGAGIGTGCGDWDWVRALSTAFSLLRHSLNVLKITVANARTRSHTALSQTLAHLCPRTKAHQSRPGLAT